MDVRYKLLRYARENRKNATKSEQIMWKLLRNQQLSELRFRRQHIVAPYVVDFACISKRLIIEIDGGYHEFISQEDQKRQSFLELQGWRILRFSSDDIELNAEFVLAAIVKALSLELQYSQKKYEPSGMLKKPPEA